MPDDKPKLTDDQADHLINQCRAINSFHKNYQLWEPTISSFEEEEGMTKTEALLTMSFIVLTGIYRALDAEAVARINLAKALEKQIDEDDKPTWM
jgi:hypothetical protein